MVSLMTMIPPWIVNLESPIVAEGCRLTKIKRVSNENTNCKFYVHSSTHSVTLAGNADTNSYLRSTQKKKCNLNWAGLFTLPVISVMNLGHIMVFSSKLRHSISNLKMPQWWPGICMPLSLKYSSHLPNLFSLSRMLSMQMPIETTFQFQSSTQLFHPKDYSHCTMTTLEPNMGIPVSNLMARELAFSHHLRHVV